MQKIDGTTKYTITDLQGMLANKRRRLKSLGMVIDEEYVIVGNGVAALAMRYHDSDNNIDYWSIVL